MISTLLIIFLILAILLICLQGFVLLQMAAMHAKYADVYKYIKQVLQSTRKGKLSVK